MTLRERFWSKVRIPDDRTQCWEWIASRAPAGYGRIYVSRERGDGWAHRVAWELTHGPIPGGLFVRHKCDNPPCVNPGHLRLGTHYDNMMDRLARGREPNTMKTRCIRGHAFTPENTAKNGTKRNGESGRACRECANARRRASRKALSLEHPGRHRCIVCGAGANSVQGLAAHLARAHGWVKNRWSADRGKPCVTTIQKV